MAKAAKDASIGTWQSRVEAADKAYEEWEDKFECDKLEEYYEGFQHDGSDANNQYTINLFFPTIEIRLPRLLFQKPKVSIKPRPAKADDPQSVWDDKVTLLENVSQTLVSSRAVNFVDSNQMALRESFYRFGIVMYGYSSESAENPNAGKPALSHDDKDLKDKDGNLVVEGPKVLLSETVYAKRIPAKQFRVPAMNKMNLKDNDWCGYFEWMYPEDIKAQDSWDNTDQVKATGKMDPKYVPRENDTESKQGLVKVWFIWDLRKEEHLVFAEDHKKFFVSGKKFEVLPFVDYRFHPRMDKFYPVPPTYNWMSPQDELNETRNQQRTHRRRFRRRYTVLAGRVKPDELSKLETGEDGVYAFVAGHDAIQAVEDAPLDRSVYANAPATKEDFMIISNVGGEQRGVSEAGTATQANIIQANMDIREGSAREIVSKRLSDGVFTMLQVLRTNYALPFLIEVAVDKMGPGAQMEAMKIAKTWQEITADKVGGFDFDVEIDVSSMAPVNEERQRQDWTQLLGLFANPTLMAVLTASDSMLRKTLAFHGVKGDKDVEDIRQSMIKVLQLLQMQGEAAAQAKAGGMPGKAAPAPTPGNADTRSQLARQMPS